MVDAEAYNGTCGSNPYNFKHHNLTHVGVYMDGEQMPRKPLFLKFSEAGGQNFIAGFLSLFTGTGKLSQGAGNQINRGDYASGYTAFCFDLSPDHCSGDHFELTKHGNLHIELHFEQALTNTVNLVIYTEFGVYPLDKLPTRVSSFAALFIPNIDTNEKPGPHWVAFYFTKYQKGEFVDSYGLPPSNYTGTFSSFLNNSSNSWSFNSVSWQSINSKVCGHYCLYYALFRCRNIGMSTIVHHFSKINNVMIFLLNALSKNIFH